MILLWFVGIALSVTAFIIERRTGWRRHADPNVGVEMTAHSVYRTPLTTSTTL